MSHERERNSQRTLHNTASQQIQRRRERERDPYKITIDEPPENGQYIAVMEVGKEDDIVVERVQPPLHGDVMFTWHEGRYVRVDLRVGVKAKE